MGKDSGHPLMIYIQCLSGDGHHNYKDVNVAGIVNMFNCPS